MTTPTQWISIRRSLSLIALAALAVTVTSGCGSKEQPAAETDIDLSKAQDIFAAPVATMRDPGAVLASVNGKDITEKDVAAEAQNFAARLRTRLPPERIAQMQGQIRQQAIDGLIMRELLRKAVEDESISVTDDDMKEMMDRLSANLPPDVTIEEHMERLNLDQDALREALRIDKLLQEKAGEPAEPTDEEIASFYEENEERFQLPESVSASHILIAFDAEDDDAAKAEKRTRIEDIRKQLDEGGDFAALAAEHSDCPSKAQGG
ncbi:MAG: SurA N-terminal domain-containing protein, partial [Kiritimatiellae bacterium]|nr:SurA N-terminal domain-containing protein [Kiritimatiellia bacterium]